MYFERRIIVPVKSMEVIGTDFAIFGYLNILITFYSLKSLESRVEDLFFLLLRLLFICDPLVVIVYAFKSVLSNQEILFQFSIINKGFVTIYSYCHMIRKLKAMREVVVKIHASIITGGGTKLRKVSIIFVILWIICVVVDMSFFVYIDFKRNSDWIKTVCLNASWGLCAFGWITASIMLYNFISFVMSQAEAKFYLNLKWLAVKHCTTDDIHIVQRDWLRLQTLKDDINDLIGVLPFLWSVEFFVSTCFRITESVLETDNEKKLYKTLCIFFEYGLLTILYLWQILWVNYFQSQKPSMSQTLLWLGNEPNRCLSSQDTVEKLLLIQQMYGNESSNEYKAGNIFTIDRKYLFAFLSAVISFSVMLIQLLEPKGCPSSHASNFTRQ